MKILCLKGIVKSLSVGPMMKICFIQAVGNILSVKATAKILSVEAIVEYFLCDGHRKGITVAPLGHPLDATAYIPCMSTMAFPRQKRSRGFPGAFLQNHVRRQLIMLWQRGQPRSSSVSRGA